MRVVPQTGGAELDPDQKAFLAEHLTGLAEPLKQMTLAWLTEGDDFPHLRAVTRYIQAFAWQVLQHFGPGMAR